MRRYALLLCAVLSSCALAGKDVQREGISVAWSIDVDHRSPLAPPGYSMPAVAPDGLAICSLDSHLYFFDWHGREKARVALQAPCESGAAWVDRTVVVSDVDGRLYGVDGIQHRIQWTHRLSSVVLGRPVPLEGGDFIVQTADNRIYRFSASGEKRWSFAGQGMGIAIHVGPSPAQFGDRIVGCFNNGDAIALDANHGLLLWQQQLLLNLPSDSVGELRTPVADPVQVGDAVLVSFYQGELHALSLADGERNWSRKLSLKSAPLVWDGLVYLATSDGRVMALDPSNGSTLWKKKVSDGELIGPTRFRNRIIVGDDRGRVYVMDGKGRITKTLTLKGRLDRPFIASDRGVLIRNDLGVLYLLR